MKSNKNYVIKHKKLSSHPWFSFSGGKALWSSNQHDAQKMTQKRAKAIAALMADVEVLKVFI